MRQALPPTGLVLTVVEARIGRAEKPPFRFLGLCTVSPEAAIAQVSQQLAVPIKEVRGLTREDGYLYGIPQEDGKATQVRSKRCPVGAQIPLLPRTGGQTQAKAS
ncbi:MAG: hypothetical protein AAF799_00650 [Myxococcota bacterium]